MGFIQGLGDVQDFLNVEPQLARADFLQCAQVEGQGRRFAEMLSLQREYRGGVTVSDRLDCLTGKRLLPATTGLILS
ncbi:hypothetical protein D3C85_1520320 [compost metagenome]